MSAATSSSSSSSSSSAASKTSSQQPIKLRKPVFVKVMSIEPGSRGHNLVVKVVDVKTVLERTTLEGSKLVIAEALVADGTGAILLTVRNDQVPICVPDSTIILRNVKVDMFKGHMRLAADKWGLIEPSTTPLSETVNTTNNLSDTEYELVNV